jgi:hypothetical protein
MTKLIMRATILCIILLNLSAAEQNTKQNIDWGKIRKAYEAYCRFPSADNANDILVALPEKLDLNPVDFEQYVSISKYIYYGEPFKVLANLVKKGDRFALRVTYRTLEISDGAYAEGLCSILGTGIRVNAILFLEETKIFSKNKQDIFSPNSTLDSVLSGQIDADEYRPEVVNKEVQLRISSLKTVDRPDLLELRDICISKLKESLKNRGGGEEKYEESVHLKEVV